MNFRKICRSSYAYGLQNFIKRTPATFVGSVKKSFATTVDQDEVNKFSSICASWWYESGDFAALHAMNLLRVPFIRDGLVDNSAIKGKELLKFNPKPLRDFKIIDVGCGGGILSEPLARLGATVTGLDAAQENIDMAKYHAKFDREVDSNVTFVCNTVEDLCTKEEGQFDGVVASEVIEHVADIDLFVDVCCRLLKPSGSIFFTTLNKTWLSYMLAIFAAEQIFRLVPKGSHDWNKFVPVEKLKSCLERNNMIISSTRGMTLNPVSMEWVWIQDTNVNYAVHAVKLCKSS